MQTIYATSFILGLTSTLHCIAMCGPISMAIPLDHSSQWKKLIGILKYQFGRILVYALLGSIAGIVGFSTTTFGIMQFMSILLGVVLIGYAWRKYWPINKLGIASNLIHLNGFSSKWMGAALHTHNNIKHIMLGMVNGILPCGMVYIGIINSLLAANPAHGALSMVCFGLGTFPSLFILMIGWQSFKLSRKNQLKPIIPILITMVGLFTILRGMNIGIPYISPKIQVETKKIHHNSCITKIDCCEKASN